MNKVEMHKQICDNLNHTYKAKNADYGDSFAKVRKEYPEAICIRLMDKLERLKMLVGGNVQQVKDESIEDTLLDLANYCIMEVVERKCENTELIIPLESFSKALNEVIAKDHAEHYWEHRG